MRGLPRARVAAVVTTEGIELWRAPSSCRKYSLDDLLTNVMIYWTSGCIVSSMRFYKENFGKGLDQPHTR